jgi:pyruvate,water dikinase
MSTEVANTTQGAARTYTCPDGTPFPVVWEHPEHERDGWRWDQMHCPLPITQLSSSFGHSKETGFNRAMDRLGSPAYLERQYVHGYFYFRSVPFPDEPQLRAERAQQEALARAPRILTLWREEYQPEVEALTRSLLTFDEPQLTLRDLVDRMDQLHAVYRRLGELHHLAQLPGGYGANGLIELCTAEFGAEGERIAAELVQGFPNKSVESAVALWDLSRDAKATAHVEQTLRTASAASIAPALEAIRGGREFLERLRAHLAEYGQRNESFAELSLPTWEEDPSFLLFTLRAYLDAPDESSPATLHDAAARRREERTAEVERRFAEDAEKLAAFRSLLSIAQQRTVVLEDHNFYIDQRAFVAMRRPCLALGRRLAEHGSIAKADDVFYLTDADIQQAAADSSVRHPLLVDERRAERERWLHVLPPATIGEGEVVLPPYLARFFGPVAAEPAAAGTVRGVAASPGVVRGTARVIRTLDEVERLSPGEILVTYATAPPWTPLFAIAAAVVTDTGGMLSHCAVVAREYGIPAIVGAKTATQQIRDGMLITVDGTEGTVRIESGGRAK